MKLPRLAALGLFALALAAPAHQALADAPIIAANYTCMQPVPCEDRNGAATAEQWAQFGNSCLSMAFGYQRTDGFFDTVAGLSSDLCLTPIPNALPKGAGPQLTPHCCIKQTNAGTCAVNCVLIQE